MTSKFILIRASGDSFASPSKLDQIQPDPLTMRSDLSFRLKVIKRAYMLLERAIEIRKIEVRKVDRSSKCWSFLSSLLSDTLQLQWQFSNFKINFQLWPKFPTSAKLSSIFPTAFSNLMKAKNDYFD